ncbi:MAG: 4Fe-4S binding protein [Mucinivorans sp.]
MAIVIDKEKCPHNHHCPLIGLCPVEAITQHDYDLPVIDSHQCIECGKCVEKCPMKAVSQDGN